MDTQQRQGVTPPGTVFGRTGHGDSSYRNASGQGWLSCHYRPQRQCFVCVCARACVCMCVTSTTRQWHHSGSYSRTMEKEWRDAVRGTGQAVSECALPTPSWCFEMIFKADCKSSEYYFFVWIKSTFKVWMHKHMLNTHICIHSCRVP